MTRSLGLFLILASLVPVTSWAHSIRFDVNEHPPVVTVHAYFSLTSPVADAVVEVFAPGRDAVYQRGRTDRAGYFAFVPSEPGEWTVRIDDERGHRGRTAVRVTGAFFQPGQVHEVPEDLAPGDLHVDGKSKEPRSADDLSEGERSANDLPEGVHPADVPGAGAPSVQSPALSTEDIPLGYRILFGLALIFGVTGFWYGMRARQVRHQKPGNGDQNPGKSHQDLGNYHKNPGKSHQNPANRHQKPDNCHK